LRQYYVGDATIRGYSTDAALGELSGEFAEPVVVLSGHEGAAPPVVREATMNIYISLYIYSTRMN